MNSRTFRLLILTGAFVFGVVGIVHAQPISTTHIGPIPLPRAVPELDPSSLGEAILILTGGLLVLTERRLIKK
jgi:hypothetical protein